MRRTKDKARSNGHVVTYKLPQDKLQELRAGELPAQELEKYLDRKIKPVTWMQFEDMKKKHGYKYVYASWFGGNARAFLITNPMTGEVEECEYITEQRFKSILTDLKYRVLELQVY